MAMFLRQNDTRTDLQQRLAAELREKSKQAADLEAKPRPDGVKDSNYMRDYEKSSRWLWAWLVIGAAFIAGIVAFIIVA